ncbi:MAG TPA: anthranilate phosphoribosyltransferase [Candidatus Saccharimonadales bacterium]|nr:anthranilate phosphoribosyltransferase [Candidatus Saccharimonadales bacterium]HSW98062.1 anthranilate phosphoribosyltransferase [Candidatus Saccharimonadales bacterium]
MNTLSLINTILQKQDITSNEAEFLLSEMMRGTMSDVRISALLTALAMKGETADEIIGFIHTMRKHMVKLTIADAIDVCGTGGDGKQTFNISTAVAFVVAGAGIPVAKHGNRAASSICGSADVLEKLGVHITLEAAQAQAVLEKVGMVFLFAPLFHPSMKTVSLVRKELGIRTIFNFLGPFCNPAGVTRQLIGVPSIAVAEKLIQVGKKLGYAHLILATSEDGLDEISITKKTHLYELQGNTISRLTLDPKEYGFIYATEDITGGTAEMNAEIITNVLQGEPGQQRDIVLLNSAVALYISGKAASIAAGLSLAETSLHSGRAKEVLEQLIQETQKYA